jgi:type II secretory pathway pseudopilin PulG
VRITPAQKRKPSEDGFILIEVLVSALILSIVAAAVLALLSATTHSAASERMRSQAVGLAQEDQARLRTMRLTNLIRLGEGERKVTLDGTQFTIKSEGTFVNAASNEVNCNGETSVADYVRTKSTVSATDMPTPVVIQSIVSPSSGSLDQNHGTLSFRVKNATGIPVSGILVEGSGPTSFKGWTDSTGCANFADLPVGNYNVTTSGNGMVNPKGEPSTTKEYGAPTAATQTVKLLYDAPGSIEPIFKYRIGNTPSFQPALVDTTEVYNSETGALAKMFGTPSGTRTASILANNLYPFTTKTTVYAGACESNNPDPEQKTPQNDAALARVEVHSGLVAKPEIQLPALNLTVTKEGKAVAGARVTTTDTKCTFGSVLVKRVYSTEANGHLSTATGVPDAGMPWGEYKVCASALVGTQQRRAEATVKVQNLAEGTTLGLEIAGGTTGACP